MPRKEDDPARIAELELENIELKQQKEDLKKLLLECEHDGAELAEALEVAKNGGPVMQSNTAIALLWSLISALLLSLIFVPESFVPSLMSFLTVGFGFVLIGKWVRAERKNGIGLVILKCFVLAVGLFVALVIVGGGKIITHDSNAQDHPIWALLWLSFAMLVMLSQFCEWLGNGIARFVDDPILTVRGWFVREAKEEGYDGQGEN